MKRVKPPAEVRWSTDRRALGGEVEWGCRTQTLVDGPMDRVYVYPTREQAVADVQVWEGQGLRAQLVRRRMPMWVDVS